MEIKKKTFGIIVGNRGFFPAHLCKTGRETILKVLEEEGIKAIALTPEDTHNGSIESLEDARKCADLFRAHRDEIEGVLVTLPNGAQVTVDGTQGTVDIHAAGSKRISRD